MSLLSSNRTASKVRLAFWSSPFSLRILKFDHSTTNRRFGALPIVCVVTTLSGFITRSSQNGAIKDGGTAPVVPPGRATVCAGSEAFWNSATERLSRLRKPFVVIEMREPPR